MNILNRGNTLPDYPRFPYRAGATVDLSLCLDRVDITYPHTSCLASSSDFVSFDTTCPSYVSNHNDMRESYRLVPFPNPGLEDLTWNEELAYTAQRQVSQCTVANDVQTARRLENYGFPYVGQNIAASSDGSYCINDAIEEWFAEVDSFVIISYPQPSFR